jgi:uracil phosphoribosyltransferase
MSSNIGINILSENNTILSKFMSEIRDEKIQLDRMRFRRNMERVGEIMAYEISKTFEYQTKEITTPLGIANLNLFDEQIVIASILRAGLPLQQGMTNFFDDADYAFVSAYRKYSKDGSFSIKVEYLNCPPLENKTLIICDPMLATGSSMVLSYRALLEKGIPKHTHFATVIASREGLAYVRKNVCAKDYTLWAAAVDNELTVKSFIIPGLGDAGDLAFGNKEH